jgi:hypothetical protein
MIGGSLLDEHDNIEGVYNKYGAPHFLPSHPHRITAGYADYTIGKLHLNEDYRRNRNDYDFILLGQKSLTVQSSSGWFATAAYRVAKKVEGHFIDGYSDTYSAHGFYCATIRPCSRTRRCWWCARAGISKPRPDPGEQP